MITKKTIKVFGVAGSGKTTTCLELIKQFLQEYGIEDVGFTTYTKPGMRSIKEKLEEANIFLPEQNYFGTLHSLCWKASELGYSVFTEKKIKDYFEQKEINYNPNREEDEEKTMGEYIKESYEYIQNRTGKNITNFNENQLKELILKEYKEDDNISAIDAKEIAKDMQELSEWKKQNKLFTYSDAFIEVIEKQIDLPVKILIVDEAQDLFKAQIEVIKIWIKKHNKEIFILAGDDDQAIHEWSGSDPSFLIDYEDDKTEKLILQRTYRCKKEITKLCNFILNEIKYRQPKKMLSEKPGGQIELIKYPKIQELIKLTNKEEKTFFLFRTNRLRKQFSELLFEHTNTPFSYIGLLESKYSLKFCLINNAIKKLSKRESITFDEACKLIEVIKTENLMKGMKTNFKKEKNIEYVSYNEFLNNILKWALKRFSDDFEIENELLKNIEYERLTKEKEQKIIEKNEQVRERIRAFEEPIKYKLNKEREKKYAELPLQLGTFHSSKGLEANKVVVFLGTSNYFSKIDDSEMRCLYVACSRAVDKLFLVCTDFFEEEDYLFDKFLRIWHKYCKI